MIAVDPVNTSNNNNNNESDNRNNEEEYDDEDADETSDEDDNREESNYNDDENANNINKNSGNNAKSHQLAASLVLPSKSLLNENQVSQGRSSLEYLSASKASQFQFESIFSKFIFILFSFFLINFVFCL